VDLGVTRGLRRIEEVSNNPSHSGRPKPHENLQLYISTTSNAVSTAIIVERGESDTDNKIQYPVYFISQVLSDSKTRYIHIMKLAYTLLITSRKLSHYFQTHQIAVHTLSTLGKILNNGEATRKIAKWAIELSMYDIVHKPRTAIKVQSLSDFMAEWTEMQTPPKEREFEYWTVNFDGFLQLQGAGAGCDTIGATIVDVVFIQYLTMYCRSFNEILV
jgi:hypothetical protein